MIETTRLAFSTWDESKFPLAVRLWGNDQVTKFIGGPFGEDQIRERLNREIENGKLYGVQYWPVFIRESNTSPDSTCHDNHFIGCCGLRPYKKPVETESNEIIYEMGFHFLPEYWGKGYAKEAALGVIQYAFDKLNADALFAGHNPNNNSSKIVLEKLGFIFTHCEFYPPTGLNHPSYLLKRVRKPFV
jgi:ribosomal-protein-alanine N-acetyltransferase